VSAGDLALVRSEQDERFKVYGTLTNLGSDQEPNHSFVVVHDSKAGLVHVLFSGQVLSNFNSSAQGDFAKMRIALPDGSIALALPNPASEYAFQLAKAAIGGKPCISNFESVLNSAKPSAAKAATNFKNMPQCPEVWNDVSKKVMTHCVFLKLADPAFYNEIVSILNFSVNTLKADVSSIRIYENTDDRVWGNGVDAKAAGGLNSEAGIKHIIENSDDSGCSWNAKNLIVDIFDLVIAEVWDKEANAPVPHAKILENIEKLPPFFNCNDACRETLNKDQLEAEVAAQVEAEVLTQVEAEVVAQVEAQAESKKRGSDSESGDEESIKRLCSA